MNYMQAIERRVSCRAYQDRPLDDATFGKLNDLILDLNARSGLRFQLYGPREGGAPALDMNAKMFAGPVYCYAALVAADTPEAGTRVGYWGEALVLAATDMGLGTCWVAGTFDRDTARADIEKGERLWDVIPIGWPAEKTPLVQRTIRAGLRGRDRKPAQLVESETPYAQLPDWFKAAIEAVLKGPSAVNKQPVYFTWKDGAVAAALRTEKLGVEYNDLGIAMRHFELAAAANGVEGRWEDRNFIY